MTERNPLAKKAIPDDQDPCERCEGFGEVPNLRPKTGERWRPFWHCPACKGAGYVFKLED